MHGTVGFLRFALDVAFSASMMLAVVIDARTRRFPNRLAAAMAAEALALIFFLYPSSRILVHVLSSAFIFVVLYSFESVWRHVFKRQGMGLGDAKAVAILALVSPAAAIAAFCLSMVFLAIICAVRKLPSLPLLPLLLPAFSILLVYWPAIWSHLDVVLGIRV